MKKYFIKLLSEKREVSYSKDFGNNEKLATQTAKLYYDADENGWISLVQKISNEQWITRIPNPKYILAPANSNNPWIELERFDTERNALTAALMLGANQNGNICIIEDDFLEEFAEIHIVLKLKSYNEYPNLDLTNISRSGIINEYLDEFEEIRAKKVASNPGSAFNLITEIEVNFDATDATLIL